jgi:hypothetical protein
VTKSRSGGEPEGGQHSTPFDVDAPWVRVTEARLLPALSANQGFEVEGDLPYAPGDDVTLDLTIASTDPLGVGVQAWLVYPDGTPGAEVVRTVELDEVLNNHVTLTLPLSTTHTSASLSAWAGPHRLVYRLVASDDADYVYASGSEAFDVGSITVLGVRTDRETYPHAGDPVTATLTVFATAPTDADLTLLVDDAPVATATLALTAGVQTIAVPVPGPMSPDWHDLAARVEVGGLSHAAHTSFACGAEDADLAAGAPTLIGASGVTRTLRAHVSNVGGTEAGATTVQVWNGDPGAGRTLIGTQPLPALAPGESAWVETTWDVLGQAGPHTLVAVVDPDDTVAEFYEHNNVAAAEVAIPPFELSVETPSTAYDEGEPVVITVRLTNLTDGALTVAVTTTVESESHQAVFTDVHTLYTPDVYADRTVTWDTAWAANGMHTIHVEGESGLNATPLVVVVNNVPPTVEAGLDQFAVEGVGVTFDGAFADPGLSDTHAVWWDFGDGITSSGALTPTHVYTPAGIYTVTLTVVDGDGGVGGDTLRVTVSESATSSLICPSLGGPVT